MGYSISDAVSEILAEMHFVKTAFQHDVVNYSALARLIKPLVEERLGEAVGLDAVVMGIRRYATSVAKGSEPEGISSVLTECSITLRTDLHAVYFRQWRTAQFLDKLRALQIEQVDWNAGEKVYVVQRAGEMAIIANNKFLQSVLDLAKNSPQTKILAQRSGLAIVTVTYPLSGIETPGIFAFLTQRLANAGVNVISVFSTYRKVSFLIEERQVAKAYELFSTAIAVSRRLSEELAAEGEPSKVPTAKSD